MRSPRHFTMAYKFSQRSLNNLQGVHPKLQAVVHKALAAGMLDFTVTSGVRTQAQQDALFEQGRTTPGVNPRQGKPLGDPVTWTRNSRHIAQADGYGHAVDLDPYPINYEDLARYKALSTIMINAAQSLGVTIVWGGTFKKKKHGKVVPNPDWGHYELV